jgi:hypothetical protein
MALLKTPIVARRILSLLLVLFSLTDFQVFATSVTTFNDPAELRDPENPETTTQGLNYDYYEGTWDALPDLTALSAKKLGSVVNIDLAPRTREDNYAFRFTGFIEAPTDGVYTFYSTSDDGSRLQIGSTTVVDNDGIHDAKEVSGAIGLKKGKHAFTLTYFSQLGASVLIASWQGPGIAKQLIPATAFSRTGDPVVSWRLEAERAVLEGPVIQSNTTGYTGSGFVEYKASGDNVLWFITTPKPGIYQLNFRYALADAAMDMQLETNTTVDSVVHFPATLLWTNWSTISFKTVLNGGSNTIRLSAIHSGNIRIDNMVMGEPGMTVVVVGTDDDPAPGEVSAAAVVPYPNPSSGKLYVDWQTQRGGPVEIELVSFNGMVMKSEKYTELRQGVNTLMVDAGEMNNGVYLVRVKHGRVRKAASVVIQK